MPRNAISLNAMATSQGPDVAAGWVASLRSIESLEGALAEAPGRCGGIDMVIAGVGIGSPESLEAITPVCFECHIDFNLNGV